MSLLNKILPVPVNSPLGGERIPLDWLSWFNQVYNVIKNYIATYTGLDFTGSNITSIVTRNHDDLQNILGAGTTHLSTSQVNQLKSSQVLLWLTM
jgi:hypothetical protein